MATVSTAQITEQEGDRDLLHGKMDRDDFNMHLPKGYRDAIAGQYMMVGEEGDPSYELSGLLPAALDYADSSATAPSTTIGDVYLLDDSTTILTVTSIVWQSGTTVRYTFSGSPDLSSYSTANNLFYIYGSGVTNSVHLGRFVATAIDNTTKYVEISNPQVTSGALDETGLSNTNAQLPHSAWNGAANGEWVRYNGTEYYRITPVEGVKCYDKTLLQTRTFNGSKWLGDYKELSFAASDENTAITAGTNKVTLRCRGSYYVTGVYASLTTAGTTSGTTTIDINESGTSILSTKLTIDFGEKTSTTAATPAVISDNLIADDAEITVDVDAITTGGTEAGLKIYLTGHCI